MNALTTAVALAAALAVAGCSDDAGSLGPVATRPTRTPQPARPPAARPAVPVAAVPGPGSVLYETWFVRDGKLVAAYRAGSARDKRVAARALAALVDGPTEDEDAAGLSSALRDDDRLAVTNISGGVATVRTGPRFGRGARAARTLREAQVVFTLTQYPTIRRVRFVASGGTSTRAGRTSFAAVAPAIVVDEPRAGATAHTPLTIAGTAAVFEGTVSIRVVGADGHDVARTFTTATCGNGCRGDFTTSVRYAVDRTQDGTVEVFEVSADDGRPQNVVTVPVRLTRSPGTPGG